jgi:hypothetical protein
MIGPAVPRASEGAVNMWPFTKVSNVGKDEQWLQNLGHTTSFLRAWLVGAFTILVICAASFVIQSPTRAGFTTGFSVLVHGAFLSLAFASLGSLVGFLFGIPRQFRQSDSNANKTGDAKGTAREDATRQDATNLEQVSDWLTKIILGAGLTQLVKVPGSLVSLGDYFKSGFNDSSLLPVLIVMNSLVFGFFAGYLLTQLFLAQALQRAQDALRSVAAVLDTAGNLERMGKFGAATATLEAALHTLRPETPIQTKKALFERLTYNALYEPPPDGFEKAIRYAEQYIPEEPNNPSARIWVNLAAALGQKFKYDLEHKAPQQSLDETRKRALEAARKAIELEPQTKALLKMLWNRDDQAKVGSEEDDLEVFYEDPDFRKLLGS